MKKLTLTALVFIFGAGILCAQPSFDKEERKKEFKEMNELVQTYQKEKSKKKKAAIEEKVKQKVSDNYDRHIKFLEEMVKKSEERLIKAKEKLAKANEPEAKEKHINEISKKILSGEKPTLFGPPSKDGKFGKKHKRHPRHMMKDCPKDKDCPFKKDFDKEDCPFKKGLGNKDCPCKGKKDSPFKKDADKGEEIPLPTPVEPVPVKK